MDILHANKEDIKQMFVEEYIEALRYAWATYIRRDVMFCLGELLKSQGNGKTLDKKKPFEDIDWTAINPVEQALRARPKKIPDNFLKMINKNE